MAIGEIRTCSERKFNRFIICTGCYCCDDTSARTNQQVIVYNESKSLLNGFWRTLKVNYSSIKRDSHNKLFEMFEIKIKNKRSEFVAQFLALAKLPTIFKRVKQKMIFA